MVASPVSAPAQGALAGGSKRHTLGTRIQLLCSKTRKGHLPGSALLLFSQMCPLRPPVLPSIAKRAQFTSIGVPGIVQGQLSNQKVWSVVPLKQMCFSCDTRVSWKVMAGPRPHAPTVLRTPAGGCRCGGPRAQPCRHSLWGRLHFRQQHCRAARAHGRHQDAHACGARARAPSALATAERCQFCRGASSRNADGGCLPPPTACREGPSAGTARRSWLPESTSPSLSRTKDSTACLHLTLLISSFEHHGGVPCPRRRHVMYSVDMRGSTDVGFITGWGSHGNGQLGRGPEEGFGALPVCRRCPFEVY